jgi:hypothetical protein
MDSSQQPKQSEDQMLGERMCQPWMQLQAGLYKRKQQALSSAVSVQLVKFE